MPDLFSPFILKEHTVKNRLVVPPMVCFGYSEGVGFVSERNIRHYDNMARGGSGIVVVEAACIDKNARLDASQLGIWSDDYIPGLSKIASAIHSHGALALIQIHHGGIRLGHGISHRYMTPSDFEEDGKKGTAMTIADIEKTIDDFTKAAVRAREAGFDGVELHACHKYLICEFLSSVINNRNDAYGADRAKFAVDIIKSVRSAAGDGFIIGVRFGGNDPDMQTAIGYGKSLEQAGADILHVSTGYKDYRPQDLYYEENDIYNWIVRTGIVIQRNVHIPVIVVNGIRTPAQATHIIEENLASFVAVGKGLLVDPFWAKKLKSGEEIRLCKGCRRCSWFTCPEDCPLYDNVHGCDR